MLKTIETIEIFDSNGTKYKNVNDYTIPKKKKVGDYKFDEKAIIGQGSYGIVYKGKCISTDKSVAIKQIGINGQISDDFEKNIREIKIAKKLEHPNHVKFYDVITTQNNIYIITEYCNGGDLAQYLKIHGPLPEKQALKFTKQLVQGYRYSYEQRIIHRDIKPANIFLKDGILKIGDYGLAKMIETGQTIMKTLTRVGTPQYMSPDQLEGEKYDSRCDVWATGFVLYEMLYGKLPWTGETEYELYSNILKKPLEFPEKPYVSEDTKDLLSGMLKIKDRMKWIEIFNHPYFKKEQNLYGLC